MLFALNYNMEERFATNKKKNESNCALKKPESPQMKRMHAESQSSISKKYLQLDQLTSIMEITKKRFIIQ